MLFCLKNLSLSFKKKRNSNDISNTSSVLFQGSIEINKNEILDSNKKKPIIIILHISSFIVSKLPELRIFTSTLILILQYGHCKSFNLL